MGLTELRANQASLQAVGGYDPANPHVVQPSLGLISGSLRDSSGNYAVRWETRQLFGTDGTTVLLDWASGSVKVYSNLDLTSHRIINVLAPVSATDAANKGTVDALETSLSAVISSETSRALAAESSLGTAISFETSRAQSAEGSISLAVELESLRAIAVEESLEISISDETSRAVAAEESLSLAIESEYIRATAAEESLSLAITNMDLSAYVAKDGTTAMTGDLNLNTHSILNLVAATTATGAVNKSQLDFEVSRAQSAESSLASSISFEVSRAVAAESSLASSISFETSRAVAAESSLDSAISFERSRAMGIESSLDSAISFETSRAIAAESSLASSISFETSRAMGIESSIAQSVLEEYSRAVAAESSLASSISFETSRAMGVESSLALSISEKVSKSGDTMSGNLEMGNNKITGLHTPESANDAANKSYVDGVASGLLWIDPILDPDLLNDSINDPSGITVDNYSIYIVGASPTGAFAGKAGHAMFYNGSAWMDLLDRAVMIGDRFGVAMEYAGVPAGGLTGHQYDIATITDATPGSIVYSFYTPLTKQAVFVATINSSHFGHSYTFQTDHWVEFSGPAAIGAGEALAYDVNTLNVQVGPGIKVNLENKLELLLDGTVDITGILKPSETGTKDLGTASKEFNQIFAHSLISTDSYISVMTVSPAFEPSATSYGIAISADVAGLQEDVNGSDISLSTAFTSGTGIRGSVLIDAAALNVSNSKIINVGDATSAKDAVNLSQLNSEASRAQSAESSLAQSILHEASVAQAAVSGEYSRALAAEGSLSLAIELEYLRAIAVEESLSISISDETSRAVAAEESLSLAIESEYMRATGVESSIAQSVLDETSRAIAAESSFASAVSFETSRAIAAESSLASSISFEVSRAVAAESSLASSISFETSRAMGVESSIAQSVQEEYSRAFAAESSLASSISFETSRAMGIESSIAQSVSNETSRAIAAESSLASAISSLTTQVGAWNKITITHSQLQAASLQNDISSGFVLPIKGMVEGVIVKTNLAFAGAGITSYNITVGVATETAKYMNEYDVMASASGSNYMVSNIVTPGDDMSLTEDVRIYATATGSDLSSSSAGSVDIWIKYAVLDYGMTPPAPPVEPTFASLEFTTDVIPVENTGFELRVKVLDSGLNAIIGADVSISYGSTTVVGSTLLGPNNASFIIPGQPAGNFNFNYTVSYLGYSESGSQSIFVTPAI